jgi:hypothetical protein
VARAKRFDRDRAEARRRHRAALAAGGAPTELGDEAADVTQESTPPAAAARKAAPRPTAARAGGQSTPPRSGIIASARLAYRRVDVRKDLRQIPALVVHRSVWVPILLSLISIVAFAVTGPTNSITAFAFNIFGLPPAMAAVFITGFFAPTAAWLTGAIVGITVSVFYSVFLVVVSQGFVPGVPAGGADQVPQSVLSAFVIGPLYGMVLGAAAAWYKRFLQYSSPRPASGRPGSSTNRRPRQGSGRPGATRSR